MKLTSVQHEVPPPPPKPLIESITITFTRQEAIDLGHLTGCIGGPPSDWPQRKTYDALWLLLGEAGLSGDAAIGKNPLRWAPGGPGSAPGTLYLQK